MVKINKNDKIDLSFIDYYKTMIQCAIQSYYSITDLYIENSLDVNENCAIFKFYSTYNSIIEL